ncbi:reverse transcriptase-like protein [Bacillus bombysepticus]|uniref:reverse transcriptase-like protein n=1 Tax=Bacillus bombysepticus TaxID=658666 RepID=UPI00301658E4
MSTTYLIVDGSFNPNLGMIGTGMVVVSEDEVRTYWGKEKADFLSPSIAEYQACIDALTYVVDNNISHAVLITDQKNLLSVFNKFSLLNMESKNEQTKAHIKRMYALYSIIEKHAKIEILYYENALTKPLAVDISHYYKLAHELSRMYMHEELIGKEATLLNYHNSNQHIHSYYIAQNGKPLIEQRVKNSNITYGAWMLASKWYQHFPNDTLAISPISSFVYNLLSMSYKNDEWMDLCNELCRRGTVMPNRRRYQNSQELAGHLLGYEYKQLTISVNRVLRDSTFCCLIKNEEEREEITSTQVEYIKASHRQQAMVRAARKIRSKYPDRVIQFELFNNEVLYSVLEGMVEEPLYQISRA